MIAIPAADASFVHRTEVDFRKNKVLLVGINASSFVLFALFYLSFHYIAYYTGIIKNQDILYFFRSAGYLGVNGSLVFIAGLLFMLLLHELIHGFFFYLFTGARPVLGFRSIYAYAAAPDWYIKKNYFLIVTLSPLVTMTIGGFILLVSVNPPYQAVVFLLMTANAAGSAGDMWISILLMRSPSDTYVNDTGTAASICN